MRAGLVQSFKETFFSFKGNKILAKLTTPVFNVIIQDRGITCTSKQVEFHLNQDLTNYEVLIMGKKFEIQDFKNDFLDLKSKFWISTRVDDSDIGTQLDGIAKTYEGKVLVNSNYGTLQEIFDQIQKFANQENLKNVNIIRTYCEKNIDLLNNQIRLLTQDKNLYQELLNTI